MEKQGMEAVLLYKKVIPLLKKRWYLYHLMIGDEIEVYGSSESSHYNLTAR
jgi:hypothetical protein